MGTGSGLAVVLGDFDPRRPPPHHLIDVGDDAHVGRRPFDGRDRSGDRLAPLRPVARHDHRLENGRSRLQSELHRGGAASRHRRALELDAVADATGPHVVGAGRHAVQQEPAIVAAGCSEIGTGNRHFYVADGLLGRGIHDFSGDRARGLLGEERGCAQQACDQHGTDATNKAHTSPLHGRSEGQVVNRVLEMPPLNQIVKQGSGGVEPGVIPGLVNVSFIVLVGMDPDLGRVISVDGGAL